MHRLRNLLAKLPKDPALHQRVRTAYWAALDAATDVRDAEQHRRGLVAELERPYPSAAACLAEDLPALPIHLRYPRRLRRRLRGPNLLERSLEEVRRRTAADHRNSPLWITEIPQACGAAQGEWAESSARP